MTSTDGAPSDVVVAFYREVVFDELLEPFFGEVAEVDWATHIPLLIDNWCRVLLGDAGYDGAILAAHRQSTSSSPCARSTRPLVQAVGAEHRRRVGGPEGRAGQGPRRQDRRVLARRLLGVTWVPETPPATRT